MKIEISDGDVRWMREVVGDELTGKALELAGLVSSGETTPEQAAEVKGLVERLLKTVAEEKFNRMMLDAFEQVAQQGDKQNG